jgi:hypothetical protein
MKNNKDQGRRPVTHRLLERKKKRPGQDESRVRKKARYSGYA